MATLKIIGPSEEERGLMWKPESASAWIHFVSSSRRFVSLMFGNSLLRLYSMCVSILVWNWCADADLWWEFWLWRTASDSKKSVISALFVRVGEERCGHHRLTKRFPAVSFSETGITNIGPITSFRICEWEFASPKSFLVFWLVVERRKRKK